VGGTSSVVRFQTEGIHDASEDELQPPELFPVYHVLTPRRSHPPPQGEPFRLKEIYPPIFHREGSAASYYATVFRNQDDFNRQVAEGGDELSHRAARSKRQILGGLDEARLSPSEALALNQYAVADALVVPLQRKMVITQIVLHVAVFLWFLFLVIFADHHFTVLLLCYFLFLGVSYFIMRYARRTKLENQTLDYRALAEGCRVRFFWTVAGIAGSVPDNYLAKQRTELDWTRNGLRGWEIVPSERSAETFSSLRERLEFVQHSWIDEQLKYFAKSARRDHKRLRRGELGSKVLLGLAIGVSVAMAVTLAVVFKVRGELWECSDCEWLGWFMLFIDLLLAAAALYHHFNERMAYSEHNKQYRRMESVFGLASERMVESLAEGDEEGIRRLLLKLGKEALTENGDWVLLHRERPLELPHP